MSEQQPQPQLAAARAAVMIQANIGGQNMIMDIPTAKAAIVELTNAVNSVEQANNAGATSNPPARSRPRKAKK